MPYIDPPWVARLASSSPKDFWQRRRGGSKAKAIWRKWMERRMLRRFSERQAAKVRP